MQSTLGKTSPSVLKEYLIQPQLTDREIDQCLDPHYVAFDPSAPLRRGLFLFLCGSYGQPRRQQMIPQQAARLGYHAINLCYFNASKVGDYCRQSMDRNCHGKVRSAIIFGGNQLDEVPVTRANSIENRLVKLLSYLHLKSPEQGWSDYLEGDSPKWESIVIAGHSQGGGHAAMIAKTRIVARVIMFDAPADISNVLQGQALWLSGRHATPADRYFGFAHTEARGLEHILQSWEMLGMDAYGPIIQVDDELPPFRGSHRLVTAAVPAQPGKYHNSMAVDHCIPRLRDGTPAFTPVWKYLIGG
jgi:hypothetical protein